MDEDVTRKLKGKLLLRKQKNEGIRKRLIYYLSV